MVFEGVSAILLLSTDVSLLPLYDYTADKDAPSQLYRSLVVGVSENTNYLHQSRYTTWRLFDGKHENYDKANYKPLSARYFSVNAKQDAHTRWLRAVELYSSRQLTYKTDRLPAISGLAAAVAALLEEDAYLAGLWKNDLMRGLLWRAEPSGARGIPDQISSIPSWSWASHCKSISFLSLDDERQHANITLDYMVSTYGRKTGLTANTNASTRYPFGDVHGGTLQITAPMRTHDIGPHLDSSQCQIIGERHQSFCIYLDDPSARTHRGVIFAVLVYSPDDREPLEFAYGLVLRRSGPSTFQRLGVFRSRPGKVYEDISGFKTDTVMVE